MSSFDYTTHQIVDRQVDAVALSNNRYGLKFTPVNWTAEVGNTYTVRVSDTDSSSLLSVEPIEYTVMPIPIDDCAWLDP